MKTRGVWKLSEECCLLGYQSLGWISSSQSIDSSYLPASRTPGLINKKAEYALVYSPRHPEIAEIYRPFLRKGYYVPTLTQDDMRWMIWDDYEVECNLSMFWTIR